MSFEYDISKIKNNAQYECNIIYRDLINYDFEITNKLPDFIKIDINSNDIILEDKEMKSYEAGNKSLYNYSNEERKIKCKEEAKLDSNKNYPSTVEMNIRILDEYIRMLINSKCEIEVVFFPVSEMYSKYFDKRLKTQVKNVMKDFIDKYNLLVYDYFECDALDDSCFSDGSHMNFKGSRKFTEILVKKGII